MSIPTKIIKVNTVVLLGAEEETKQQLQPQVRADISIRSPHLNYSVGIPPEEITQQNYLLLSISHVPCE